MRQTYLVFVVTVESCHFLSIRTDDLNEGKTQSRWQRFYYKYPTCKSHTLSSDNPLIDRETLEGHGRKPQRTPSFS